MHTNLKQTSCLNSTSSPGGGIGRRAGLKHQFLGVPVRSRSWVQKKPLKSFDFQRFLFFMRVKWGYFIFLIYQFGSSPKVDQYCGWQIRIFICQPHTIVFIKSNFSHTHKYVHFLVKKSDHYYHW